MSYSDDDVTFLWHVLGGVKGLQALRQGIVKEVVKTRVLKYRGSTVVPHVENPRELLNVLERVSNGFFLVGSVDALEKKILINPQYEGRVINFYHTKALQPCSSVLDDVGVLEDVETTFLHIVSLLSSQMKGESGALLTNGDYNLFYAETKQVNVLLMMVSWTFVLTSERWQFKCRYVEDLNDFYIDSKSRIFFPVPVLF
ncbi:TPA: hypothetical protein DEP58_02400 [Patescibacteria group bacterium]|nr:MAG: hypothetical protein UU98_C0022G0002 [Parcubacteria group bacterium GW2011_GWD2_42_14]HCC05135.1 hypothetical protein [Patescibacteria group bacterium]